MGPRGFVIDISRDQNKIHDEVYLHPNVRLLYSFPWDLVLDDIWVRLMGIYSKSHMR